MVYLAQVEKQELSIQDQEAVVQIMQPQITQQHQVVLG